MRKPLKYENIANIGDRIRAYDFYGRTDCYVEGVVHRIDNGDYAAFVIAVDKEGWPKRPNKQRIGGSRIGCTMFVPMEVDFMEYDGRIVNLSIGGPNDAAL